MFVFIVGTRPEYIKLSNVWKHLPLESYKVFFTGQHDLRDFSGYSVNYTFNTCLTKASIEADISLWLQRVIRHYGVPSGMVVQGDTYSAFRGALVAFKWELPLFHVEAGLRTYDLSAPYPEEGYRQMISRIAQVHFCPTHMNAFNLRNEDVPDKSLFIIGNPGLDSLPVRGWGSYGPKVLVTMHRRENHKDLHLWFEQINIIAKQNSDIEFIIPLHQNPAVKKHASLLTHLTVVDPLPHSQLIDILKDCSFIITDSGGLQEEACWFNKKAIVCRKNTERPEGIESGHLTLCKYPLDLPHIWDQIKDNPAIDSYCPFGNGNSGSHIAKILMDYT